MKPNSLFIPLVAAAILSPWQLSAEIVNISTPNTSLVLDAEKGAPLKILHYGDHLQGTDLENVKAAGAMNRDAYPVITSSQYNV